MFKGAPFTGGCQCGAVRFEAPTLGRASICHCRMCQKAFGNAFAPLVNVNADFRWTKGPPAYFQSSNLVRRGFCARCGTPLSYEAPATDGDSGMAVAIGAFDDPAAIVPDMQYGIEGRIAWMDHVNEWPVRKTSDSAEDAPFLSEIVSHQHPDHDCD